MAVAVAVDPGGVTVGGGVGLMVGPEVAVAASVAATVGVLVALPLAVGVGVRLAAGVALAVGLDVAPGVAVAALAVGAHENSMKASTAPETRRRAIARVSPPRE